MDLVEDEPRKHPKPVPFCQSSLLQPTVPEVSLILQDKLEDRLENKNDSFSGTEFQTYNAWRWKNLKTTQEIGEFDINTAKKCINVQDCCLIKDKYFSSNVERRKNEILYGQSSEPRRPLPPRASPVIPKVTEIVFPNTSFDDLKLDDDVELREKQGKRFGTVSDLERNTSQSYLKSSETFRKEFDNNEKLYNIISEQNKQIEVLQKQIEQLLKLQEVKDKQIEQLLKSQELKENKIKQLLKSLDMKDREVEELLKLKERQELQLQELIKSQETKHLENLNLIKKLNEIERKNVCSVGIMTSLETVEVETNTSFNFNFLNENLNPKDVNTTEEDICFIKDLSIRNEFDRKEKSLSLHSSDLPTIQEHVPTPQSSIHVDIQDFHDSSDESESDIGNLSNFQTATEPQSTPLGYTFYNNVLTQVKGIIQNSCEKEANQNLGQKQNFDLYGANKPLNDPNYVTEQKSTIQSFQGRVFHERENIPPHDEISERSGAIERFPCKLPNLGGKDLNSPTDISLKINALALKYLKKEQISQYNIHPNIATSHQGDVTIYNVTNLSFGSMRYMDRYKILPKATESQQNPNVQQNECSPAKLLRRKKKMILQENLTPINNILDISTLNQQPKLL